MKARYLFRAFKARYRDQRREINILLDALKPGDVAVDAGAHKGAYVYWMRRAVGPEGKVFAFEPQPRLAAYLQSICRRMRWENVEVRNCALSDRSGTAELHVPGQGTSPSASLHEPALGEPSSRTISCRLDTLDAQLLDVRRVALLKVDVEGHELEVFRGGIQLLQRDHPVLLFECEQRHLKGRTMQDVFNFLEGLGYEGAFFSPHGLRPLSEFNPQVHQKQTPGRFWDAPDYCNNFLFRPGGRRIPPKPPRRGVTGGKPT